MKSLLIFSAASFSFGYGSENIAAAIAAFGWLYTVYPKNHRNNSRGLGCLSIMTFVAVFWLLVILFLLK